MRLKTDFKRALCLAATLLLLGTDSFCQGIPYIRNFTATEYGAHNRNFDIIATEDGFVFSANFEGLLVYNKAVWSVKHTSGVQRLTSVFQDSKGKIWAGGYNFMGYVEPTPNGDFTLKELDSKSSDLGGEVSWIWENGSEIQFLTSEEKFYRVSGNKVEALVGGSVPKTGASVLGDTKSVKQVLNLGYRLKAIATEGDGLYFQEENGKTVCTINEENGLCSNNINHISYDGHGIVWGATDNGIFAVNIPSSFSRFTPNEGLKGEVLTIEELGGRMFVGSMNGLFMQSGLRFKEIPQIRHACWQLTPNGGTLLAATSDGVFRISPDGSATPLTTSNTTAVLPDGGGFYSGELDGVYFNSPGSESRQVSNLEKVTKMFKDSYGNIWAQNLYGQVRIKPHGGDNFMDVTPEEAKNEIATLLATKAEVCVATSEKLWSWNGSKLMERKLASGATIPYPQFSQEDSNGILWLTDQEGKHLYATRNEKRQGKYEKWLGNIEDLTVRALHVKDSVIWIGGGFGVVCINTLYSDPNLETKPNVRIRSVRLRSDSLLWGGATGVTPKRLHQLRSKDRNLTFTYSTDFPSLQEQETYRHRLNGEEWSSWKTDKVARLINQPYGDYTFEVQAKDAAGNISNTEKIAFSIAYPFYMRWYMICLYVLTVVGLIYMIFQYRMRKLQEDKVKLEKIVSERTAEVVKQKDEIEKQKDEIQTKSNSLEKALSDLENAQKELVRQEKMATAGKLTQGLIDRILNPLNYINNFSKLSTTLVKDIKANIEDEKDSMDEENYEDTLDTLEMLNQNLLKVEEHGTNTSRTLKAMEELLRDRSGGMVEMDLCEMLRNDFTMLNGYYNKDIGQYGIKTSLNIPEEPVHINGNSEQLSKSVMSILANGIYAVKKKKNSGVDFTPEVSIRMEVRGGSALVRLRDNGIGIEETILQKIFDPFFTTKTTGEAAGVGLYLSREIAQNHGGEITAKSKKNEYSEFTITLPILK